MGIFDGSRSGWKMLFTSLFPDPMGSMHMLGNARLSLVSLKQRERMREGR